MGFLEEMVVVEEKEGLSERWLTLVNKSEIGLNRNLEVLQDLDSPRVKIVQVPTKHSHSTARRPGPSEVCDQLIDTLSKARLLLNE
jgi:hypothetical protein